MKKSGHKIFKIFYNIVTKYPTPGALNYAWNFGVLALLALGVQIITGIVLAMYYTPHVDFAFFSVERIMRDINYGYILRGVHATGASFFFIVIYLHILRGIFYGSYQFPRYGLWISGIIIFFVMIITAFLGYLLPWGQMSFWGGTVITNLVTILPAGDKIVEILWGAYSVSNPTLNKFFALHFVMPFILIILVTLHLIFLHTTGSNNALGISSNSDKIFFAPYYIWKDFFTVIIFFIFFFFFTMFNSEVLSDPDNFIPANPLVTPPHIVPEWYFLPFYAILRCIPNKTLGVLGLLSSIILLGLLPFIHKSSVRILNFKIMLYFITLLAALSFLALFSLGAKPIHEIFVNFALISIAFYVGFFILAFIFDTKKRNSSFSFKSNGIVLPFSPWITMLFKLVFLIFLIIIILYFCWRIVKLIREVLVWLFHLVYRGDSGGDFILFLFFFILVNIFFLIFLLTIYLIFNIITNIDDKELLQTIFRCLLFFIYYCFVIFFYFFIILSLLQEHRSILQIFIIVFFIVFIKGFHILLTLVYNIFASMFLYYYGVFLGVFIVLSLLLLVIDSNN